MAVIEGMTKTDSAEGRRKNIEAGLVPSKNFRRAIKGEEGIPGRMGLYGVPGLSVAVVKDRRVDWAASYGVKEAGKSDAVTEETAFQALSVAKIVSAMGALRLAQEGKFSIDDDVNDHLKTWKLRGANGWTPKVTIRQLLSHTGGVKAFGSAGYPNGAGLPTLDQVLEGLPPAINAPIRVATLPGICYDYAGSSYCVIQKLVEDVTSMPYEEAMRTLVLEPLEMKNSFFAATLPKSKEKLVASGHCTLAKVPLPERWLGIPELASSGLWSTAVDLAKVIVEIQNAVIGQPSKVLDTKTAVEMLKRHAKNAEAGLGLFTHNQEDPELFYFNMIGQHKASRCSLMGYVINGTGSVIMANSGYYSTELTHEILGAIGREYGWKAFTVENDEEGIPDATLSGEYELGGAPFSVRVTRDTLELLAPNQTEPLILKRRRSGCYRAEEMGVEIEPSPTEWSSLILRQRELEWTLTRRTSRSLK